MARSLRDDLASLQIERRGTYRPGRPPAKGGRGLGVRLLTALVWLVTLALLGGAGAVAYLQYEKIRPRLEVTVALVQAMTVGEAETLLSAKGYIKSYQQAEIGAKVPGRVEKIRVREGVRVGQDELLAVLEHREIEAQRDSRRAMLLRSQAELKEAQAELEWKERRARRYSALQVRGTATAEEIEQFLFERDMCAAKVAALKAAIDLQSALVAESEAQLENMTIRAPFAGTVVSKQAEVGETITPGGMGAASGRGSVVTLADLQSMKVETDIAESLLSRVALDQPAEVSVSAVPDRRYTGRLTRIIPMGDRTRGTVKVDVKIDDPNPDPDHPLLFPELVATVHFLPKKDRADSNSGKTYLFVPKAAIFEEAGHFYAWVVDSKQAVHKQQVDVVVTTDDLARVEKGLPAGASVVLNPDRNLRENEPIRVAD